MFMTIYECHFLHIHIITLIFLSLILYVYFLVLQRTKLLYRRFWSILQMNLILDEMFTPMVFGLWIRVESLHNYMDTSLGLYVKCHLELP